MPIRTPHINQPKLQKALEAIYAKDRRRTALLTGKNIYMKPAYAPWAKEVWVTRTDVFLPSNFNEKSALHQIMDVHRVLSMLEEQEILKREFPLTWYASWITSRKIGMYKKGFNLRIRILWRQFMEWRNK